MKDHMTRIVAHCIRFRGKFKFIWINGYVWHHMPYHDRYRPMVYLEHSSFFAFPYFGKTICNGPYTQARRSLFLCHTGDEGFRPVLIHQEDYTTRSCPCGPPSQDHPQNFPNTFPETIPHTSKITLTNEGKSPGGPHGQDRV